MPFICFKFLPFLAKVPLLFVWVISVYFLTSSLCWLLSICMQSVTPNLAFGGEIFWVGQHRKSGLGSSARYSNDKMVIWLDFIWVLHEAFELFLLNCLIGFLSCYIIWVKNGVLSMFPFESVAWKVFKSAKCKAYLVRVGKHFTLGPRSKVWWIYKSSVDFIYVIVEWVDAQDLVSFKRMLFTSWTVCSKST